MPTIIESLPDGANLAAALGYARRGWAVFPCHAPVVPYRVGFGSKRMVSCSCGHADCEDIGKHPACAHGFRDATTDAAVIRGWFAARSNLNIAIATGGGLLIMDIDPRNGGGATLAELERKHDRFPRQAAVVTGGGGIHLYYSYLKALAIKSLGDAFGAGVDLKADGGYVIAPPSLHKSGKSYRWLRGKMPAKLPAAPKWLLEAAASGAARAGDQRFNSGDRPVILTRDHPNGLAIAKVLGARDCRTYWRFACPVRAHRTPDAAMYPWPNGQVNLVCYSKNSCSHNDILAAIKEKLR